MEKFRFRKRKFQDITFGIEMGNVHELVTGSRKFSRYDSPEKAEISNKSDESENSSNSTPFDPALIQQLHFSTWHKILSNLPFKERIRISRVDHFFKENVSESEPVGIWGPDVDELSVERVDYGIKVRDLHAEGTTPRDLRNWFGDDGLKQDDVFPECVRNYTYAHKAPGCNDLLKKIILHCSPPSNPSLEELDVTRWYTNYGGMYGEQFFDLEKDILEKSDLRASFANLKVLIVDEGVWSKEKLINEKLDFFNCFPSLEEFRIRCTDGLNLDKFLTLLDMFARNYGELRATKLLFKDIPSIKEIPHRFDDKRNRFEEIYKEVLSHKKEDWCVGERTAYGQYWSSTWNFGKEETYKKWKEQHFELRIEGKFPCQIWVSRSKYGVEKSWME